MPIINEQVFQLSLEYCFCEGWAVDDCYGRYCVLCGDTLYLLCCPPWIVGIPCHPVCPLRYRSRSILFLYRTPIGWYVCGSSILRGVSTSMLYLLIWNVPFLFRRRLWDKFGLVHGKLEGSSICLCGPSGGSSYGVSYLRECWSVIGTKRRHSSLSEGTWLSQGSV